MILVGSLFIIGVIERHYQGLCVSIHGDCGPGALPNFYINGRSTIWPEPGNRQFNATYSSALSSTFCFNNITEDTIITEYCYRGHMSGCSICPIESGEIRFLSYSDIHVSVLRKHIFKTVWILHLDVVNIQ